MADAFGALPDPDALIFDLDGTLVDTVEARIGGWLRTFDEIGMPADREHVASLIGSDGKRLAREVARRTDRDIDDEAAEDADRRAGELYDELNTDPRPLPGARELLIALEGPTTLRWAIATSSRAQQVLASVDALRLPQRPRIVDGSHVEHAKPEPDLLLLSARNLGVEPGRAWYVGDSTWDMLAARNGGLIAVGVTSGAVDAEALTGAGAHVALASLEQLHEELTRRGCL